MRVLRWGQSAYETDEDMALERAGAEALGLQWSLHPDARTVPDLADVDALVVTSKCRVSAAVLEQFPGSLVLTTTSGHEHIDTASALRLGKQVGRSPIARRDAVVEFAIGNLLGLIKRFEPQLEAADRGHWCRADLPGFRPLRLSSITVLVLGANGVIGRRVCAVLQAFGAEVLGVDPAGVPEGVEQVTLDDGLSRAHAVTVHCASTPSTRGLLDASTLGRMRRGAVLVNTARGDSVDADAAAALVAQGHLSGLALDVFAVEPWPRLAEHAALDGVWLFPHAAGYAEGLGRMVADEVVASLTAWREGKPLPHPVLA